LLLELYHFHGATCGLKARLALAEKGAPYKEHAVGRPYLRTPEYLAINPNGVVPTLVHDGSIIKESSVVINYVDDALEGPALKPNSALGVAGAWWWMKRADECLPFIGTLTYTVSMRPKLLEKPADELERYIEETPNPALRDRRRRIVEQGFQSSDFPMALEGLTRMLADMENTLRDQPWLVGSSYTLADTAMTPLVERLDELQCHDMYRQSHPGVARWRAAIQKRPSYEECLISTPNPEKPQHEAAGKQAWSQISAIL
jgi:glutathione S-transferase